jgi:hypothetical protein
VLEDELAVAGLMAVELKAGLICDQRLKQLLALDKGKRRDIPTVDVQEVEDVIDEPRVALAAACVCAKLGNPASSTPQSSPSRYAVFTLTSASAAMALGYLSVQSSPVRVRSCTRPLSIRAAMRKPSSLISCSH